MNSNETFFYFWQGNSPFSQWHMTSFVVDGISFNCAEQYMMYQKAMTFGDQAAAAAKILKAKTPKEQKAHGRHVKPFSAEVWEEVSKKVVYAGNHAKFTQNKHLLTQLLAVKETTLVEASPYDTIWGIGLKKEDTRAKNRQTWLGENRLGEILTTLRNDLLAK